VLCLDLSESMSKISGVSRQPKVPEEDVFNYRTASLELLEKLTTDVSTQMILEKGERKSYLGNL
jgi:hypothetical protein